VRTVHTKQNMGSTTGRRRRLGQGVKRVWPVALIGLLLLSVAWTGESGADPDHQHLAAARPANHVPGGINLGLTGLSDQAYAARVLEHKMHDIMKGGFTQAAAGHFGGGLDNESVALAPQAGESVSAGPLCPAASPVKSYDLSAINVEITLNAYHDFFPGYMYVLTENIDKVRAEEKKNEAARKKEADPGAITTGLSGDVAIQPLVIRANQGDCLRITLTNKVDDEDVGLHVHGSSLLVKTTGTPATQTNPDTVLKPGKSQSFEWYVKPDTQEGARQFHSHTRDQSSLGLMGVLVVEPNGSVYLDPHTGGALKSGWLAMIGDPNGPDFREFVVVYSEAGNEETRPLNKKEDMIPQRDTFSDNYRPSSRLLNYRSESFFNRMVIQQKKFGFEDESMGYSAYTFGDVVTPVPRSYVGDPAKWRLVHAGSEAIHSHHLHGGAIRWRRQPLVQNDLNLFGTANFALAANGPVKFPPIQSTSDRLDVQTLGPAETFTNEIECGTGGCQHLAGDFLYHCHIPHHYVAGMWAYWRSYNTLQSPGHQTDVMAPLQELPDRKGKVKPAVDSTKLVGSTVHWFGKNFTIADGKTDLTKPVAAYNLEQWVEMQIPAQGKPGKVTDEIAQIKAYDATVLDWVKEKKDGTILYLNEPETTQVWPAYKPAVPGGRPPFLFDPQTGRLAYPHLKPHLGKRPLFAPNHNGAPWAEPIHQAANGTRTAEPARPGENGPWSLCPVESNSPATMKKYVVNAITLPITLAPAKGNQPAIVDKKGQIYVNAEEEAGIRADDKKKIPLVLRANVGDCVDVIFKSKLDDNDPEVLHSSKVNMHIHFVQFDTQASDGVITGMSYEQSVRPFTQLAPKHEGLPTPQNTTITTAAAKGKGTLTVADASRFHVGTEVGIGMDKVEEFEVRRIEAIKGNTLTLHEPLSHPHQKGEIVSVEFVRYRWYVDSDFGMTFWHDHAFGLTSWAHGLFGGLVAEPRGSTYHDPMTGKEVRSGNIVDIHTNEPVSAHIRGGFREMVPQIMDDVPRTENRIVSGTVFEKKAAGQTVPQTINKLGSMDSWSLPDTPMTFLNGGERTTGSAFGLRVEPLWRRLKENPDPSQLFSSAVHGDPATMMLNAYVGDPIVVRSLQHSANDMNTLHIDGHWFPFERFSKDSRPRNAVHMGIAERYDIAIPAAGGPQQRAGDYLFYNGRASKIGEGSWGLIRVLDKAQQDLLPLPGHERFTYATGPICPSGAPLKRYSVVAIEQPLDLHQKYNGSVIKTGGTNRDLILENKDGKIFVLEEEVSDVTSGKKQPHPLTLHVNIGDCIQVTLKNNLAKDRVSFHPDLLAFDPHDSYGVHAGKNKADQTVAPGQSRLYTFYAHPEYREATALIRDWGNPTSGPRNGLYGAIVIGPKGSSYRDPVTKADVTLKNAWQADVLVDQSIPENVHRASYRDVALFFQDEDNLIATAFMPYIRDAAGLMAVNYRAEPLKWRVKEQKCPESTVFNCQAAGEPGTPIIQAHVGDRVKIRVLIPVSEQNMIFSIDGHEFPLEPEMSGSNQLASLHLGATETFEAEIVAGGDARQPGEYVYMNHRMMYAEGGQWGLLRVLAPGDTRIAVLPRSSVSPVQVGRPAPTPVRPQVSLITNP